MDIVQSFYQRQLPLVADSSLSAQLYTVSQLANTSGRLYDLISPAQAHALRNRYLRAGVQILLTNTFDANRYGLRLLGLSAACSQINQRAVQLTRAIARGAEQKIAIGGVMGPIELPVSFAEKVNAYAEQAEALAAGGADMIWLESFCDQIEIEAALSGCRISAPNLPLVVTLAPCAAAADAALSLYKTARWLQQQKQIVAFGVDGGRGDDRLIDSLKQMRVGGRALAMKADIDTAAQYSTSSRSGMTQLACAAAAQGARIIAVGRNATPEHVAAVTRALQLTVRRVRRSPQYAEQRQSVAIGD